MIDQRILRDAIKDVQGRAIFTLERHLTVDREAEQMVEDAIEQAIRQAAEQGMLTDDNDDSGAA